MNNPLSGTLVLKSEDDTRALGLRIAEALEPGDVTKYIAAGLGITEEINSPTFTIVKQYRSGRLPLYHFDVYRLGSGEELLDIGAEEMLDGDGACVIEWADIVADVLPEDALAIQIEYGENEGERIVEFL